MTTLLKQAFARASQLPSDAQDTIGALILEELEDDKRWTKSFKASQTQLAKLAKEAQAEYKAGKTRPLDV
ncbi:MAG: hypothetical protein HY707_01695 [Ignavibacteriae bacterium]|nr:hypothetical protein [Ignavibacteriota bacterium]